MKNGVPKSLLMLVGTIIVFASCKKSNDSPPASNSSKIVGSWKTWFNATDYNGNNSLDPSEKTSFPYYEIVTFLSNGAVTDTLSIFGIGGSKSTGTWSIGGDYITVNIAGSTTYGHITQLDDVNLIIRDTSAHPSAWVGLIKQ